MRNGKRNYKISLSVLNVGQNNTAKKALDLNVRIHFVSVRLYETEKSAFAGGTQTGVNL